MSSSTLSSTQQLGFADLIAPLTPADIAALWRSRTLKYEPRSGENRFPALLDWGTLWDLIERKIIPLDKCRVTYGRRGVPPLFYTDAGKLNPAKLARLFDQGSSVIVSKLDEYVPAVSALRRDAMADGVAVSHVTAIVTTGGSGALQKHYDVHDLIVVQMEGGKAWRVYGPRDPKPVKALSTKNPPQTPPLHNIVLRPGDILFVPAGTWHVCDNGPDRSLHLALLMKPPADDMACVGN